MDASLEYWSDAAPCSIPGDTGEFREKMLDTLTRSAGLFRAGVVVDRPFASSPKLVPSPVKNDTENGDADRDCSGSSRDGRSDAGAA